MTVTPSEESTKGTVKSGARDGPGQSALLANKPNPLFGGDEHVVRNLMRSSDLKLR